MWDLSILQVIPGLRVAAPRDAVTLREELREAVAVGDGPTAIRFPTGAVGEDVPALERLGTVDVLHRGPTSDVLLVAVGAMGRLALDVAERAAAQGIGVTVVDPRWIAPVAPELIDLARAHALVVTVEDSGRTGGAGSVLSQALRDADVDVPARDIGIPRQFLAHGTRAQVQAEIGLTAQEVARRIVEHVARTSPAMEHADSRSDDRSS
jgi:1-deoxy-D-xylulose-5-phosphate synthase